MTAYYNEFDPQKAAWLRELIKAGHIAPGVVDERSIEDVTPNDLAGFTQCHFFAGVAVWSYALRLAGWPDCRPVWTASCPCPPFSVAGKKKSCPECGGTKPLPHAFRTGVFRCTACGHDWYADKRHLWPELYRLIREFSPVTVFGEQVGGRDGLAWGDIVQATLELERYTVGRVPFAACGVGAPNIRQRLYWVADSRSARAWRYTGTAFSEEKSLPGTRDKNGCLGSDTPFASGTVRGLADATRGGSGAGFCDSGASEQWRDVITDGSDVCRMGDACSSGLSDGKLTPVERARRREEGEATQQPGSSSCRLDNPISNRRREGRNHYGEHDGQQPCAAVQIEQPGPVNGFWRDADWLHCRDEWWRPVKPGTFPLVNGAPARVVRLRGYGDAINAEAAKEFIMAFLAHEQHMRAGEGV